MAKRAGDTLGDSWSGPGTAGSSLTRLLKNLPGEYAATVARSKLPRGFESILKPP
jgi:hypothetical protein